MFLISFSVVYDSITFVSPTQYLSYTTNLILHLTSLSPDYGCLMFEQPLSECRFEVR